MRKGYNLEFPKKIFERKSLFQQDHYSLYRYLSPALISEKIFASYISNKGLVSKKIYSQ